jgi:nicotinamide-nucleotide amidase
MSQASIIAIGNEILTGHTVNTNAAYLAGKLLSIGVSVVSDHTVGDDINRIVQTIGLAAGEADFVLITGGLGPTEDDLTRQALAKYLDAELRLDSGLLKKIEEMFESRRIPMPANNKLQAYLPSGTSAITNNIGTAAGISAKRQGKSIFVMPGVPYEMKQMFEEFILPQIEKQAGKNGGMLVIRKLNCFGAGESKIAEMLSDIADRKRNPQINYTVNYGVVTIHITARADTLKEAAKLADADAELISKRLGSLVFSTGGQTLAEVVGRLLTAGKKTLAIAESCTGGLLGSMITDIPGASRYFTHGWITYSNNAKITELGVPAEFIEKYGAVSEEVASAMANQAKKRAVTNYAIAITGIAGPDGGTAQKPAGLVFIGIAGPAGVETKRFVFTGNRTAIRISASTTALNALRLKLQID